MSNKATGGSVPSAATRKFSKTTQPSRSTEHGSKAPHSLVDEYRQTFESHEAIALGCRSEDDKNIVRTRTNSMLKKLQEVEKGLP